MSTLVDASEVTVTDLLGVTADIAAVSSIELPRVVASDGWCTSRDLALALGRFDLDPCSNPRSHIQSTRALSLENGDDGLATAWHGSVFVNGPYSNPLPWCRRLAQHDGQWVALWKLDPSTKWWATLMESGATWAPFRKRLKFEMPGKPPLTANFPSVLVWNNGWSPSDALRPMLWLSPSQAADELDAAVTAAEEAMAHAAALAKKIGRRL